MKRCWLGAEKGQITPSFPLILKILLHNKHEGEKYEQMRVEFTKSAQQNKEFLLEWGQAALSVYGYLSACC